MGWALPAAALVAALAAAPASPAPGPARQAARTGTIRGAVGPPPASQSRFHGAVVAVRLAPAYGEVAQAIGPGNAFRLSAAPGLYVVSTTGWRGRALRTTTSVVSVASGRPGRPVRRQAAVPAPTPVRVSVGGIHSLAADASPEALMSQAWDSLMAVDLLAARQGRTPSCEGRVSQVVDRRYGRLYGEAVKELRLQTTRYFSAADRASARSALANLHRYAPTVRLTGTVEVDSPTRSAATMRLEDPRTGRTTWEQRVEVAGDVYALSEAIAKAAADRLCTPGYDVAIALRTDLTAATHTATGAITTSLVATSTPAGAGDPTSFEATGPVAYEGTTFASTIGCPYIDPVIVPGNLTVTLTATAPGRLSVRWGLTGAGTGPSVTASIACPDAPAVAGQPGPTLVAPAPLAFTLPADGGTQAIGGGFAGGGGSIVHSGTITVTRR